MELEADGTTAKTTSVSSVEGDVELNQRKGKPIAIFDLHITVPWEGSLADGTEAKGRIKFPEVLNDQTASDIEVDVTVEGEASAEAKKQLRDFVKNKLVPVLKEKILQFPTDLINGGFRRTWVVLLLVYRSLIPLLDAPFQPSTLQTFTFSFHQTEQAGDLIIPQDQMNGHPTTKLYTPPPKTPSPAPVKPEASATSTVKGTVVTIDQDVEFQCTAADLWITLLDKPRVSAWTRAPAEIQPGVGLFNLFGGNITGYITNVEQNKSISMRWRLKTWPAEHFSSVEIKLDQQSDCTKLHLKQDNVPIGEKDQVSNNWTNFYW